MSYSKKKNTKSYLATFGAVMTIMIVAFLAVQYIEEEKEEHGENISDTVVISTTSNNNTQQTQTQQERTMDAMMRESNMGMMDTYKDGSYTVEEAYFVKGKEDVVEIVIEIKNDKITNLDMDLLSGHEESTSWINSYVSNIEPQIKGMDIDDVEEAFLSGATLTSDAFRDALVEVKTEAKV